MKLVVSALIFLSAVSATAAPAAAQGWKGLVPLHSTRADVERALGKPTDPGKKGSAVYDLRGEVVLIFFSGGPPCGSPNVWSVEEGTVVDITVTPKRRSVLSEMSRGSRVPPGQNNLEMRMDLSKRESLPYA
jgi:hypothetical protein